MTIHCEKRGAVAWVTFDRPEARNAFTHEMYGRLGAICADLDKNVFYEEHTDPRVAEALRDSHWYEVREWTTTGPGTNADA